MKYIEKVILVIMVSMMVGVCECQTIVQQCLACKGSAVEYTCNPSRAWSGNFSISPSNAGVIQVQERNQNGEYIVWVLWNSSYSGNTATVNFNYWFPFRNASTSYTVNFPSPMVLVNPQISGNSCAAFNSSGNYTLTADQMTNVGNVSWNVDGHYYIGGQNMTTANILFNDPIQPTIQISAQVSDMCGNISGTLLQNTVNVMPSSISSIKGSQLVCSGIPIKYQAVGSANAQSFQWTCTGATITNSTQRVVSVTFPSAGQYQLTVVPINTTCGAATAQGQTINVTVDQSIEQISEVDFYNTDLTSGQVKSLQANTCSDRCSDCPVSMQQLTLYAQLDLGDVYNLGSNPFETSVVVQFRLNNADGSTVLLDPVTMSIGPNEPKRLYVNQITNSLDAVRQIDVLVSNYQSDPLASSYIRLKTYYTETDQTDVSGVTLDMLPQIVNNNEVTLQWQVDGNCNNTPNYQLEMMRLYDPATLSQASDPTWSQWQNAVNIQTENSSQQYTMVVAEGTGMYVSRVRALGNFTGQTQSQGSASGWSSVLSFNYVQPEDSLNWIYSRTFTEGNKIGESMSYSNGLGMESQKQTRLHDNNMIIATKTVQDYSGRDALKSLAIPVKEQLQFGYITGLLTPGTAGIDYTADNFDADNNVYNPDQAFDMDGYYGPSNIGTNSGVADAQGVPYVRTIFTNDASGKVREQASAGLTGSVDATNGSKTIKTFYTNATNDELIRLFGCETPYASDVYKVIKIDPNGTATVTYIDKNGKTIATALSISGDGALDPLSSQAGCVRTYTDSIKESVPFGTFGTSSSKPLVFTSPTSVTVNYNLTPQVINDLCSSTCNSCDYQVQFWLHDKDLSISTKIQEIDIAPGNCNSVTQAQTTFTMNLEAGHDYVFEKRVISHTQDANGNYYLDDQLQTLQSYYSQQFGTSGSAPVNAVLSTVESYLQPDNNGKYNTPGLYQYLTTQGYLHTIINGQDNFVVPLMCNMKIYIPNYPNDCVTYTYTPGCFLQYFQQVYGQTHPEYFATTNGYLNFAPIYTPTTFNELMDNLVAELGDNTNTPEYDFNSVLWPNWMAQVQLYGQMQVMQSQPANLTATNTVNNTTITAPSFDLLQSFFRSINAEIKQYYTTMPNDPTQLVYAYKTFYYNSSDPRQQACMTSACNWQVPMKTVDDGTPCVASSITDFTQLPDSNRNSIANCIVFGGEGTNLSSTDISINSPFWKADTASLTQDCQTACTNRSQEFQDMIVNRIHDELQYIEGDTHALMAVPESSGEYRPWGDTITPASYVLGCEVSELTTAVVNYCQSQCSVSIVPQPAPNQSMVQRIGTSAELQKIAQVINGAFDIQLPQSVSCNAGYVNIPITDQGPYTLGGYEYVGDPTLANAMWNTNDQLSLSYTNNFTPGWFSSMQNDVRIDNSAYKTNLNGNTAFDNLNLKVFVGNQLNSNLPYGHFFRMTWDMQAPAGDTVNFWLEFFSDTLQANFLSEDIMIFNGSFNGLNYLDQECNYYGGILTNYYFPDNQIKHCEFIFETGDQNNSDPISNFTFIIDSFKNLGNISFGNFSIRDWTPESGPSVCPPTHNLCFKWLTDGTTNIIPSNPEYQNNPQFINSSQPIDCSQVTAQKVQESISCQLQDLQDSVSNAYTQAYTAQCGGANFLKDKLVLSYPMGYYHYNLFYYDRSGNLIRTVPPAGVDQNFLSLSLSDILSQMATNPTLEPSHTLVTWYQYNSLHQLVHQHTPDANTQSSSDMKYFSDYYYDSKGRLRFSQSSKQKDQGTYSYTKYDALGRIIEVGESSDSLNQLSSQKDNMDFPPDGTQKTVNVYSMPASQSSVPADNIPMQQNYLRNRISFSYTDLDGSSVTTSDRCYTWYSYDPHGNVEWIVEGLPGLDKKQISYQYDLLSNKVTMVSFNVGQPDQFFHRYQYDADNRIITVYSSHDNQIWDCDATYSYYEQGPLKRVVLGNDQIQGIDYTYTINGWMKGINHPSLNPANDPGGDGTGGSLTASDVFGMVLSYYTGDYVNPSGLFTASDTYVPTPGVSGSGNVRNLYNGNISAWANNLATNVGMAYEGLSAEQYSYDELNRITSSTFNTFSGGSYQGVTNNDFGTSFAYDPNGNILSLNRNANSLNGANTQMDQLSYTYNNGTNQLNYIQDAVTNSSWKVDISNQSPNNYAYDEEGNLISDIQSNISSITWTVYGKIGQVVKGDGTVLQYMYNASGKRISKTIVRPDSSRTTTYYVLDPQGNDMAIYTMDKQIIANGYNQTLSLSEQPIYGSDRLGENNQSVILSKTTVNNGISTAENVNKNSQSGQDSWMIPASSGGIASEVETEMDQNSPSVLGQVQALSQGNIQQVAVADDKTGNLQFSFSAYDNLNGQSNAAVVLDKNGNLMPGQAGIHTLSPIAQANGQSAIVRDVTNAGMFYLYTIGPDGTLYRHTVNMQSPGNGTILMPLGDVVSTNQTVASGATFVPTMVLASVNTGTSTKRILYLLESTSNTPNNLQLEAYDVTGSSPVKTVLASLPGNTDQGKICISPDGQFLAVGVNQGSQVGFFDFTNQGSSIQVYLLGTDYLSATLQNTISTGGCVNVQGLSFSTDCKNVYYTSTSADAGYQLQSVGLNNVLVQSVTSLGAPSVIALAPNDKMYVSTQAASSLLEVTTGNNATPTLRNLSLGLSNGALLEGVLPTQPFLVFPINGNTNLFTRQLGNKTYELKDHLGDVRMVISDRKLSTLTNGQPSAYLADIITANNYYPFGMLMPQRTFNTPNYRFGFNGKEKDDEFNGSGVTYDYGFRIYDARIAKFLSVDPLTKKFPELTPYQFASNRPIDGFDLDGLEYVSSQSGQHSETTSIQILSEEYLMSKFKSLTTQTDVPAYTPENQELKQGGIYADFDYQVYRTNLDNISTIAVPGYSIVKKLLNGEEITKTDIGLEIVGIIPIGKIIGGVGKASFKVGSKIFEGIEDFYKITSRLDIPERIAAYKEAGELFAKENKLEINKNLMKKNLGRTIYTDSKSGLHYSLDTQHGRFEILDKKGHHQGEIDFGGKTTKEADKSGEHDIIIK